jgi:transposase InsO family protein
MVEHRYRAVRAVLDGGEIAAVARQFGTSRQSLYTWIARYREGGLEGLADRSRRPRRSPTRIAAQAEASICELRRRHPRWGAQRIAFELSEQSGGQKLSRSTVYRVLVRNGLVDKQHQQHRRRYRRWQRDAPMQLWQLDIMGGVFLADGRECKLVTGIDDHSRFVVIARVVTEPSGRAVCQAFTDSMARFGVPSEVLTDNGKQFTGRYTKPFPAEVLFERVCRENGINARLTKPRTPTTTGKIERWHQNLRREFLDEAGPFADLATAQTAIDAWVHGQGLGVVGYRSTDLGKLVV